MSFIYKLTGCIQERQLATGSQVIEKDKGGKKEAADTKSTFAAETQTLTLSRIKNGGIDKNCTVR